MKKNLPPAIPYIVEEGEAVFLRTLKNGRTSQIPIDLIGVARLARECSAVLHRAAQHARFLQGAVFSPQEQQAGSGPVWQRRKKALS